MAIGIGTILGGIGLAAWGGFRNKVLTSMFGVLLIGIGAALIGLAPAELFWLLVAGGFVFGFAASLANGPIFAVLQAVVAPEMQGRVFALIMTAALAITPLSLLVAGPLADLFGIRLWYLVAAITCLVVAIIGYLTPDIRDLETRLAPKPVYEMETAMDTEQEILEPQGIL